jgi:hypothetical protein
MPLEEPNTLPTQAQSEAYERAESLLTPREVIAVADEEIPMLERRRDTRYPTNDPAEVEIFPQAAVREGAVILDVSRSGLRVHLRTEAPKGTHLKIRLLKTHLVIFGEVRYCRAVADGFHVGVWIEHMFNAREELGKHIDDMDLCMYVLGKGLTVEEVILLKDHLITCEICQVRAAKKEAALHPVSGPKNKTHTSGTE